MRSSLPRALCAALCAAASWFCLSASTAWAQIEEESAPAEDGAEKEYRFEFGIYGGGQFFAKEHGLREFSDSPIETSPKTAGAFGARLTMNFNPYVGIEGDAWWTPTKTRGLKPPSMPPTLGDGKDTRMSVFGYRVSLIVNFVGSGPFRPFLQLGAGGLTSVVDNEEVVPGDQDPTVHGGLGTKIYFGSRAGLRLDGIIMGPPAFASPVIKIGRETEFGGPDFQVLGTLFFNFSEVEKSSRHVIERKETVIMQPPPPPPPTPVDPDADGISGDADKCPNVAEDRDGFEDEDGCPENDNDQDGIPDAQDKCPMKPENKNGIDDDDGCPEEDTDGDGFVGSRDKCPDAPETKNNFQDDDGCPDEIPIEVKKFTGVIEGINFKTGSADILPGSYVVLDRAVQVLKDFPDIRLEIAGHTDNRGKADYNRDLSQRRAESVRNYFIAKGIRGERLQAVGYGFDRPIADNASEFGRSKNRRTEFKLIGGQ